MNGSDAENLSAPMIIADDGVVTEANQSAIRLTAGYTISSVTSDHVAKHCAGADKNTV